MRVFAYMRMIWTSAIGFAFHAVCAQPGALDPSFAGTGVVTTTAGSFISDALDIAVQADGKVVVAGYATEGADWDIALARYDLDGSLDGAFGAGGIVTTDIYGNGDQAGALVITDDQKIVVASSSWVDAFDGPVALARYDSNGTLDSTFGSNGVALFYLSTSVVEITDLALQVDGKLVVAGNTSNNDAFLIRCGADGEDDPDGFAQPYGWATAGLLAATRFSALAVQSDGKLLAAGTMNGEPVEILVVRFQPDGTLDETFGDSGLAYTYAGGVAAGANAIAVQPDGKIVLGGWFEPTDGDADWLLLRYMPDGSLDPELDGDGIVTVPFNAEDAVCHALVLQSDGAIVMAGQVGYEPGDIGVARYLADGTPDPVFGDDGLVATDVGTFYEGGRGVALQADGKILVCGWAVANGVVSMMVARYQDDFSEGAVDRTGYQSSLDIFPRPAAGRCTVVLPFEPKAGTMVRLFDVLGRERTRFSLTGRTTLIEVEDLAPGRYACIVDRGAARYVGVIVKQ